MSWLSLLPSVIAPIGNYLTERQAISSAKSQRKDELKKLNLEHKLTQIANASESDIEADNKARSIAGWMDDVSFAIFLIPAVFAFYPPALPHIEAGFKALETMPEWYKYILIGMLASVFGYKRFITPILELYLGRLIKGKKST